MADPKSNQTHLKQERELDVLLELSASLASTTDVHQTLRAIATQLAASFHSDRCAIVFFDAQASRGSVVIASEDPDIRNIPILIEDYPEILEVVRTKEPLVINDVFASPLLAGLRDKLKDKGVGGAILFPLQVSRHVRGVIMLRSEHPRALALEQHEIRFGQIVANATGVLIRNAQAFEQLSDLSERALSDRSKAHRRLQQIEKYQRFFDYAGDGLVIVDSAARILYANRAAMQILGFDAQVISQIQLYDIAEKEAPIVRKILNDVQENRPVRGVDLNILNASGQRAILSVTASALEETHNTDEWPRPIARKETLIILSFRDVTETRRMRDELARAQKKLELSERQTAVVELAGTAAHELNQPLTSILGAAEILVRRMKRDNANIEIAELIVSECERMIEIVKKLGQVTRYETKPYVGNTLIVDLDASSVDLADSSLDAPNTVLDPDRD